MSTIGQRIKILRIESKLTQEQFGNIFGIVKSTVSMYENDNSTPDTEMLKKLSKFFNVSIDYLLGLTDIREPAEELIKKGEVSVKPPSDIEKIYESLPAEEKEMFEDYAQYLETRAKLSGKDREISITSEVTENKKAN